MICFGLATKALAAKPHAKSANLKNQDLQQVLSTVDGYALKGSSTSIFQNQMFVERPLVDNTTSISET